MHNHLIDMNVELLSKMLKNIILTYDEITLPGFGSFVAEEVPASFTDKGYTVNPPYRKIAFRPHLGEDTLLAEAYSKEKNITVSVAQEKLESFFAGMKDVLRTKKTIIFPGLGKMRATKENNFFFVCDENLDIFPEGFGLEPISLKALSNSRSKYKPVMTSLSMSESKPNKTARAQSLSSPSVKREKRMPLFLKLLITAIVLVALAVAALFILKYYAPDVLDRILYTEEELVILNYQLPK